ncbi:sensor histidine kinase [Haloechinothrix halophila]|uniref:sensor histidine kinase n=1 Tax=Haloechinothrix halophila TaxID=1069073 RepID=UPI0003F616C2|nr:nitrate- and nitrite sensing domain-containing protein [Haloechinothrix halophila]
MPRRATAHPDDATQRASAEPADGEGSSARREPRSRLRWLSPSVTGGSWRLRNWSLRTKLIAALLVPTMTALVLIGMRFNSQVASASELAELSARVKTDTAVASLVHVLQRERDLTVRHIARGRQGQPAELRKQRDRVDKELGEFSKALAASRPELSRDAAKRFEELRERLDDLSKLRFGAEHAQYPADAVLRSYSELISALLSSREQSVATINEPELVRLQLAGSAVSRVKDQMSVARALVAEALVKGSLSSDRERALTAASAEVAAWRTDFRKFATPEQQRMYDDTVTGLIVDQRNDTIESVLVRTETGQSFDGVDPGRWETSSTYTINLVHKVEKALLVEMQERTDALAGQARTAALRDSAIVIGVLLIAVLLALVIARSLLRPLRTLRSTALEVAEYRLPAAVHGLLVDPHAARSADVAPVPVNSNDEVGHVARAFDAVHGEAIRLATEQAELRSNVNAMFVNLSRRGQELADRQLDMLDRMEAEEQDPDTLASLFELDHLATRSRRICENLLVLTGNDFARMLPGTVAASEVVGAALSEIEQYQRVELASVPDVAVRGDVVSDVVHVISELLENATNGSPYETTVTLTSSVARNGAWLIEITDSGPGMSQEAIDSANARLAELPEIDVEASRKMGLYVVGRLAQRNGLEVRLRHAPTGGLTASVLVPAQVIGELSDDTERGPSTEPGRRPEWLDTVTVRSRKNQGSGPPKRAPVVTERSADPEEGVVHHPFDDDQPTERLPVYKDLLTRWFREGDDEPELPGLYTGSSRPVRSLPEVTAPTEGADGDAGAAGAAPAGDAGAAGAAEEVTSSAASRTGAAADTQPDAADQPGPAIQPGQLVEQSSSAELDGDDVDDDDLDADSGPGAITKPKMRPVRESTADAESVVASFFDAVLDAEPAAEASETDETEPERAVESTSGGAEHLAEFAADVRSEQYATAEPSEPDKATEQDSAAAQAATEEHDADDRSTGDNFDLFAVLDAVTGRSKRVAASSEPFPGTAATEPKSDRAADVTSEPADRSETETRLTPRFRPAPDPVAVSSYTPAPNAKESDVAQHGVNGFEPSASPDVPDDDERPASMSTWEPGSVAPDDRPSDQPSMWAERPKDAANGVNSADQVVSRSADEFAPPSQGELDLADADFEASPVGDTDRPNSASSLLSRDVDGGIGEDDLSMQTEVISRAPDAVRGRMRSLSEGMRRARQGSDGEYADSGHKATVGVGQNQWLDGRVGSGGKEG